MKVKQYESSAIGLPEVLIGFQVISYCLTCGRCDAHYLYCIFSENNQERLREADYKICRIRTPSVGVHEARNPAETLVDGRVVLEGVQPHPIHAPSLLCTAAATIYELPCII